MKIVFVSNYYNHHQAPLSEEFFSQTNGNYIFIQTMPMEEERKLLGWGECLPSFVIESYKDNETYKRCLDIIYSADVVIVGSAPEKMIHKRIKSNKLTFRYSERIYKNWKNKLTLPLRFVKYHLENSKNTYLLCASAYAAADYAKTGNFIGKAYKWGYFPQVKEYNDIDEIVNSKVKNSILWVARLIEFKHPEVAICIAKMLKDAGYNFDLSLIGNGKLENQMKSLIETEGLEDCVHMLGAMNPNDVRKYMEQAQIFLFTSDFNEGWGAVLNEAMNSACAVVASNAIGSVPFLVKNGENGFIYKNGDIEDLYSKVEYLINNPQETAEIGRNAYKTMFDIWNAKIAAKRFIKLFESFINGYTDQLFDDGPCSISNISPYHNEEKTI